MVERNFVKTIQKSLTDNWDRPCFSNLDEEALSYGEVAEKILFYHALFEAAGLKEGDKCAVCGKNSVNWAIIYLATVTYGAVIVPILVDFPAEDIENIVNHSDSRLFFADFSILEGVDFTRMDNVEFAGKLEDLSFMNIPARENHSLHEKAVQLFFDSYGERIVPEHVGFSDIPGDQLEGIVYTSGTTGFSKGVMLSHNALMANVDFAQNNINLAAGDRIVSFLPVAHSFGCAFEFLFPFCTGCHVTFFNKRLSPQVLINAFQQVKPRLILSIPLLIEKIYFKQIKPKLEKGIAKIPGIRGLLEKIILKKLNSTFGGNFICIIIGAAAFNPEVEAFLTKIGFRFTVGYGMTECGPLISYTPWDRYKGSSSGKIINYLEGKIDSPDPVNVQGEICVRGDNVMMGYYKNIDATREAIDEDGWLHTGDMGTLDEESVVFIKGRCKNMILGPSGQNIYPEELEAKLCNNDIVADALVLERDEKIVALLHPDTEYAESMGFDDAGTEAALQDALRRVNGVLPAYSRIDRMEVMTEVFEKTPTSKIKRYKYA